MRAASRFIAYVLACVAVFAGCGDADEPLQVARDAAADVAPCWASGLHQAGKRGNFPCCEGLLKTPTLYWSHDRLRCEYPFGPGQQYSCRAVGGCGNGPCEAADDENLCTCAQDCQTPYEGAQNPSHTPGVDDGGVPLLCPNESVALAAVPDRRGASAIALQGADVYLQTRSGVVRIAKTGGSFTPVVGEPPRFAANNRATDGTYVYYHDGRDALMQSLADGSMPAVIQNGVDDECFAVAVDAHGLYWTNAATGLVYRAFRSGNRFLGAIVIGYGGASDCDDDYDGLVIAVDESSVYWTAGPQRTRASDDDFLLLMKTCK